MGMIRHAMLHRLCETGNDAPADAVRPFDADATGTAHGEGGGLLILEEYDHANAQSAKIYAELVGFGRIAGYLQRDRSLTRRGRCYGKAISKALADANIPPAAIDLMIPCGLGIRAYDQAELNGLSTVFGAGIERVAMSPMKGQIGSLAAGSSVETAAAYPWLCAMAKCRLCAAEHGKPLDGRKTGM